MLRTFVTLCQRLYIGTCSTDHDRLYLLSLDVLKTFVNYICIYVRQTMTDSNDIQNLWLPINLRTNAHLYVFKGCIDCTIRIDRYFVIQKICENKNQEIDIYTGHQHMNILKDVLKTRKLS